MKARVMIVDDELAICVSLSLVLRGNYEVSYETDPGKALCRLGEETVDLVILDLRIGEADGLEFLRAAKEVSPDLAVIMMTAFGDIRSSVEAMQQGAFTYLTKPLDIEELQLYIRQALEFKNLNHRVNALSSELKEYTGYGELVGGCPPMRQVYHMIEKLKDLDTTVLVSGESGTGKELVARAIHYGGPRKDEPFVCVNCAAIPDGLLEDEFFGHKRGAFTGAVATVQGRFARAGSGTVFLDEIGDMPLNLQGKLLRTLQEKQFSPIGGSELLPLNARIIAATNRDLGRMVAEGTFRQDLFYRICVIEIKLPPLRQRKEDILPLCAHFIKKNNQQQKKTVLGLSREAEEILLAHSYPGNVRELANMLEYACIFSAGEQIEAANLPALNRRVADRDTGGDALAGLTLRALEKRAILTSYERHGGKRRAMAEELGISERSLWSKLREYGVL